MSGIDYWLRPLTSSLTPPGGNLVLTLYGHGEWVEAVAVIPDGTCIVSGSDDGEIKVWDFFSGKELAAIFVNKSVKSVVRQ